MELRGDVLVTGATGLLGGAALAELLRIHPRVRALALVRTAARARSLRRAFPDGRVVPLPGDLRVAGLGLDADARDQLSRVSLVLHSAAETNFGRPLEQARAVNTHGTARLLELCAGLREIRFVHLSTAFVAGRRTGNIPEAAAAGDAGFANSYEQSKREAEELVLRSGLDAVVLRPSTLACDAASGAVLQQNALHRALWLTFNGLVPMLPGSDDVPLDVVPHDWAARAVARLATEAQSGAVLHLCAGARALQLGALLDRTLSLLRASPEFRRRDVSRPSMVDAATWRLFSATVEEVGEPRLRRILAGLSHFVPQLSLPKRFETARADALLGEPAPAVEVWWPRMIAWLLETRWAPARAEEAA